MCPWSRPFALPDFRQRGPVWKVDFSGGQKWAVSFRFWRNDVDADKFVATRFGDSENSVIIL